MIDFLTSIDHDLFVFLHNAVRSNFLDSFMLMFTGKWIWVPFYVSISVMIILTRRNVSGCLLILFILLAFAATDQTCHELIRPVIGRLRPCHPDNPASEYVTLVNGFHARSFSFPSCHAANSMLLAVFMVLYVRRRWFSASIIIWAVLHSLSRVYLGVHYPGDLLIGWLIGAAFAFIFYYLWILSLRLLSKWSRHKSTPHNEKQLKKQQNYLPLYVLVATTVYIIILSLI